MRKRQPGTRDSNEGTGNILGVPDESTVVSRASSEGTGSKPGVPDEEKLILEWEADVNSEHFDRDDNAGDDNEETKPDPEEIYNSGPGPQLLTPRTISSGLVPQPPSPTPNVPPTKNDCDLLFCPMLDEYFNPSTSTLQTTQEEQSHVIPTSVEEDDHGIEVAHMDNDLPVSTSLQLQTEALLCYYDALLSSSERKSYKDALTKSCWIDAMKSFMKSMANAEHAPAMAPPVRTDEQIVPRNRWVPIGKSILLSNEEKISTQPIFKIAMVYSHAKQCSSELLQLHQQYRLSIFNNSGILFALIIFELSALASSTTNDMFQPWRALTTIINLCLTGKTSGFERPRAPVLQILWGVVNRAYIDYAERMWEEFTQSIHTFTEDKRNLAQHTLGKKKATFILIPSIRFTKLIIFHLQRLHNFHPRPESPLHLPTEEPVLGHLKFSAKGSKREVFGMTIPNELINDVIRGADYYDAYLEKVAKHQRYIAGEELSDPDSPAPKPAKPTKQAKPKAPKQTKPTEPKAATKKSKPAPAKPQEKKRKPVSEPSEVSPLAKRAKAGKVVKKRTVKSSKQLVDEFIDEGVPAATPRLEDTEEEILQKVLEESLTDAYPTQRGPLRPVVFRETDTGKLQPLPEVPGKGKEKVGEEQAAQVLLNLQTPKKKSPAEQYIFQRRSHVPTETSGREDSTSLYAELGLSGSDTDSDEATPLVIKSRIKDEGQTRLDPGKLDEGQAGPNPDDVAESQPLPTPSVLAGPNLEHSDVEITDASSQPQPEHMDEGFTATAYPNVQENLKLTTNEQVIPEEPASSTGTLSSLQQLGKDFSFGDQFFNDKPSDAENEKTTADTEAESMVSVSIQQDTSVIPPMTSPVIGPVPRPDSPNVHWPLPTTTTTTSATTTTNKTLHTTTSSTTSRSQIPSSSAHGVNLRVYRELVERFKLWVKHEIDRKINESVKEVVISSVKHAMRAPLRARLKLSLSTAGTPSVVDECASRATGTIGAPICQAPPPHLCPLPLIRENSLLNLTGIWQCLGLVLHNDQRITHRTLQWTWKALHLKSLSVSSRRDSSHISIMESAQNSHDHVDDYNPQVHSQKANFHWVGTRHMRHLIPDVGLESSVPVCYGLKRSADERQILDEESVDRKKGLYVRYPETTKDKTYLPEYGKLCWWTDSRRRLPVTAENRMRGGLFYTLL
ncbi:hypothetical protein Tco_0054126 [Tanacetum coccineum]